ncbi:MULTISPECIES: ActS/PrrB/RegB family redox-sensitive histidine kinase [unclassified Aureimonas]|uniref:ActS/PrrB/RegB family redox-sensitive histidine kinase n=1 Tax=unclassified Aureimonas TaxID=2615206 RepID=UPI0006F5FEBB|nr:MULTISPECIES: ActS/PrrB/RegB family redox-sensitive histidine kinase [unclassified Aureimonas]KQT64558.1 ATPase [Aureimonas sp. Leaf427]KQT81745.1 ATPase [Aureimonas sp. Leaf460]
MHESQRLRLATLTRLRWLSVAGQTAACVFVAWALWYPYPVGICLALIAVSAGLNVVLGLTYPKSRRLSSWAAVGILTFDILQPSTLLYVTGGIQNPFAVFLIIPVLMASATQPPLTTIGLGILAVAAATFLAFFHMPLPWPAGVELMLPASYVAGLWYAIAATIVFAAVYVYRVAAEARTLADALGATELVLQREQHLSALDGLAAAAAHELGSPLATIALVAKEMGRTTRLDAPEREDVELLMAQSERCRDILRQLTSLSSSSEEHMARLPLLSMVEEVSEPHRHFGIAVRVEATERGDSEPVMRRNAGVLYGLGNIVENAVDFAASEVVIRAGWSAKGVDLVVLDDGPGFAPEILARIGDPYMSRRDNDARKGGGLGLGLFIAKTLLERSGATLTVSNRRDAKGASVAIHWPREAFVSRPPPSER